MAAARKQKQLNECLLWAADRNAVDKLKYYLDEGANVDKQDAYRRTSLIKVVQHGNIDAFESLIAHGASVNKTDVDDETALLHACYKGCFDIMCRLIELGADVNYKNKNDETAIYIASKYGHFDCVRRLVMVGGDYSLKSKFSKTALDVAVESMHKAARQKNEEKCRSLENIIELLTDADEIEALRKQEKMFTLTPEEFRLCLERSEYRSSDISLRIIGLNDESTMVVTRSLIGRLGQNSNNIEMVNGISLCKGICDLNMEKGEWIIHEKISDRTLIYRQMGEVVRHYVNTHNFKEENLKHNEIKRNKQSYLFRSNTTYSPDLSPEPFTFRSGPSGLDHNASSDFLLRRSQTSTSLYALKTERSVVSLSGMDIFCAESIQSEPGCSTDEKRQPEEIQAQFRQWLHTTKNKCSKVVQYVKEKMENIVHGDMHENTNENTKLIRNRKQVYDTFDGVKNAMQRDNSQLASISLWSLSGRPNITALHRLLFTSSAIYIFVIDSTTDFYKPSIDTADCGSVTNGAYVKFLVDSITKQNSGISGDYSKIIFLILDTGDVRQPPSDDNGVLQYLETMLHDTDSGQYLVIDSRLQFTYENLYSDKKTFLVQQISTQASELIQQRRLQPATWLALQEAIIYARENKTVIMSEKELIEVCVNHSKNITSPSHQQVQDFLQAQTTNGTLIDLHPSNTDYICLEIPILYQLILFFNHVSVSIIHDKFESIPLIEKLRTVADRSIDSNATKCYLSLTDPLLIIARSLHFVETNAYRLKSDSEAFDLFVPDRIFGHAPENLILQFYRFEYSASFGLRFKHSIHAHLVLKHLTCALYEIWPFKQLHNKNLVFTNFVAFTLDNFHCVTLTVDNSMIIINVSRNFSEKSNVWSSRLDVCNGIYAIVRYLIFKILNVEKTGKVKGKEPECVVMLDTCSLTPPCMVDTSELSQMDSYTCDKHNTFINPGEVIGIWNISEAFPMILVEDCRESCKGPPTQMLAETLTDKQLGLIIRRLAINSRRRLIIALRSELHIDIIDTEPNVDKQLLFLLIRWRNSYKQPKMEEFQKLLMNKGETKHVICKMFQHPFINTPNSEKLQRAFNVSPKVLNQLSLRLITRSVFLALELGLDVVEFQQISKQQKDNPLKTTRAVLALCQEKPLKEVLWIFQELGMDEQSLNEMTLIMTNNQD